MSKNKAAASLGKKGGLAKSPAKTAAVRENGKKGGRPNENAALRGAMARLCRAVSARMQADEPTPEERIELMEAYDAACALLVLSNTKAEPRAQRE